MINTTPSSSDSFTHVPAPVADHDPVGRHGKVLSAEMPILPQSAQEVRAAVEGLYADFDAWEARILATIKTRTGEMALADTVNAPSVDTHRDHAA